MPVETRLLANAIRALSMDAVARTYRYLDSNEVAAQKKPAAGAKK